MIVADTNLIAYLLLPGPHHQNAVDVFRKDHDWKAPFLWRSEFANILALYLRQKHFALPEALDYMEHAMRLLKGHEFQVSPASALALAESSNCSAYDCEFLQLARDLDLFLVTSDKKLLRTFPSIAQSMDSFLAS